ncbi:hypothetical protein [Haliea sp. E17]|uniref:hypothetical protein n=1 Tax=Haliea sp. E17 TaxID=3401576 RepID=UPI003AB0988D
MQFRFLMGALAGLWLSACGQYDLTVNDRTVYTPLPLFKAYAIPDTALEACVKKAINYYKVANAVELQELDCSDAGVSELTGIGVFTGLRRLRLGDNQITSLAPLATLSSLEALEAPNNQVKEALPLYDLLSLRIVDLRGNSGLHCPRPQDLFRVVDLSLPQHCD